MLVRNNQQRSPPMNAKKVKMHQAEILRKAGHKQRQIAEILGVSERMVRNYLKPKAEMQHLPKHSLLDPYQEYITSKIEEALGLYPPYTDKYGRIVGYRQIPRR